MTRMSEKCASSATVSVMLNWELLICEQNIAMDVGAPCVSTHIDKQLTVLSISDLHSTPQERLSNSVAITQDVDVLK